MRRKDREMGKDFALAVVDKCEYAVISMTLENNTAYSIPISIIRDGEYIYFHSALEGKKIDALRNNPHVCITCVGNTNVVQEHFTTEYESAIIVGIAEELSNQDEMIHGLKILCEKYTPLNMANFSAAIEKSLFRTAVWKVKIQEITGKRKKYDSSGVEMKFGRME